MSGTSFRSLFLIHQRKRSILPFRFFPTSNSPQDASFSCFHILAHMLNDVVGERAILGSASVVLEFGVEEHEFGVKADGYTGRELHTLFQLRSTSCHCGSLNNADAKRAGDDKGMGVGGGSCWLRQYPVHVGGVRCTATPRRSVEPVSALEAGQTELAGRNL